MRTRVDCVDIVCSTGGVCARDAALGVARSQLTRWPEGRIKIARMTLTAKLDWNWSSFQLANSAPPLSVTDSAIAPSARMVWRGMVRGGAPVARVRGRFVRIGRSPCKCFLGAFVRVCETRRPQRGGVTGGGVGAAGGGTIAASNMRQRCASSWVVGLHGSPQKL